jgi:hypothetical protein
MHPVTVNWDILVTEMKENLNTYLWGIQWAILSVLRQFFTGRENSITTKMKAGKYTLAVFQSAGSRLFGKPSTLGKDEKARCIAFDSLE